MRKKRENIDDYISVSEYARRKNISVQAVYKKINSNNITFKKIHGLTLVKA